MTNIIVIILYVVLGLMAVAVALAAYLLSAIGLYRICKKLDAGLAWLSFIPVLSTAALIKAGDAAADRKDPDSRRLIKQGIISMALTIVFFVLTMGLALAVVIMAKSNVANSYVLIPLILMYIVSFFAIAFDVWMCVLFYISYYRVYAAFTQGFVTWLLFAALFLVPGATSIVLLVLSFFPPCKPEILYEN